MTYGKTGLTPMMARNVPGISTIVDAVEAMTGETASGLPADIAADILAVTRKGDRRPYDSSEGAPPQSSFVPDAGKTAFVVKVYSDGERGLKFTIGGLTRKSGSSTVTIEWGDGTSTTTATTTDGGAQNTDLTHTYAQAGCYMIQISNDITIWRPHLAASGGTNFTSNIIIYPQGAWSLVVTDGHSAGYWNNRNVSKIVYALQWGTSVTSASWTYQSCVNLMGRIPEWGPNITNATATYRRCPKLEGPIPVWNSKITSASYTYYICTGLTGRIPEWNEAITDASYTYCECAGLTGMVPEWNTKVTNAQYTYYNCQGLTGRIPAWNGAITNANSTYYQCFGVTGQIPEWTTKITNAQQTYAYCSGLTGGVPEWGENITNANSTYQQCRGISGRIPA